MLGILPKTGNKIGVWRKICGGSAEESWHIIEIGIGMNWLKLQTLKNYQRPKSYPITPAMLETAHYLEDYQNLHLFLPSLGIYQD